MERVKLVRVIAGVFVTTSALLGYFHSRYWLWFTVFVGLNLFQYGFTDWCTMEKILKKLDIGE